MGRAWRITDQSHDQIVAEIMDAVRPMGRHAIDAGVPSRQPRNPEFLTALTVRLISAQIAAILHESGSADAEPEPRLPQRDPSTSLIP
jgi:hypothetical protein